MKNEMRTACLQIAMSNAIKNGDETVIVIRDKIAQLNADLMKILENRIPQELQNEKDIV